MTAKEQLRERVEAFSEAEAADALRLLDRSRDSLTRLLDEAPLDDQPTTPEEEDGVAEARADIARGDLVSTGDIRRDFG